jgi:hypothetical protein
MTRSPRGEIEAILMKNESRAETEVILTRKDNLTEREAIQTKNEVTVVIGHTTGIETDIIIAADATDIHHRHGHPLDLKVIQTKVDIDVA